MAKAEKKNVKQEENCFSVISEEFTIKFRQVYLSETSVYAAFLIVQLS